MNRHVILFFLVAFVGLSCVRMSKDELPNIIIINIDDMGWKDVAYMGSTYYETPRIDELANQGMQFSNGYAASANCAPSRACLLTGKWTPRHGIYTVGTSERGRSKHRKLIPVENTTTLSRSHRIIPRVLQQKGYVTCHAGKWHLSDNPLEYGFDINIGGGHNGHPGSYYPPYKNVNITGKNNQYLTDLIMERTIAFADTVRQPFFLYYAPYAVHTPIQPVKSLSAKYEDKAASGGQNNAAYATMIENVDRNIGLLTAKLKEKNLYDNTLLIFTSDNGGLYGVTEQHPLRAGKGSYYEGGIRVPFFFIWKDHIKADTKSDVPVTNLDIYPTLLKVAGIDGGDVLDGANLLPILKGDVTEMERPLFWHFPVYLQAYNVRNNENRDTLFRTRPGSAVRKGKWKLHYYFENNEFELFNLDNDIGEKNNVAQQEPAKAEEMLLLLKNWWKRTEAPIPRELNPEYDDAK